MAYIKTKGLDDIRRKPKKKCDIRKAKRLAHGFVSGMRNAYSHLDDDAQDTETMQDLAAEIEMIANELETAEDPCKSQIWLMILMML